MSNPQQQNSDQDQDQDSSALFPTDHSNNRQPSLQQITLIDDRVNDEEEMHETHDLEDDDEQDDDEDDDSHDYYDPQGDIARYHEQRLEIEESWLEWERQAQANNRQNYIFQKPGSAKRRDRRERYTQLQMHRQGSPSLFSSPSGSASGSASVQGLDPGSESSAAIEKLRRLGSYRPALASSIVHSYSNLSWEAVQAAREKRLAAKAISSRSGANVICTLPVEVLSHIVSHLDPNELFNVSLVCQLFYHVVNADSCWKAAFMKFFGGAIPFKRLDAKSWRGEYIKRTRLLRRWEKGRGSNIMIDPKIGNISKIWAEADNRPNEGWFLAGGVAEGVVARCNPLQGKVQKDAVLRMLHLLNAEVSTMTMDRHRVLWGLSTGQVSLTTLSYAAAGQSFQTFAGFHDGPVSCVKLVPNHLGFVLTGGVDGAVKLWDVTRARCVCDFRTGSSLVGNARIRIDFICCEPGSYVIAGASNGEIYIWDIDISTIIVPPSTPSSGVSTPGRTNSTDTIHSAAAATPSAISPEPTQGAAASTAPRLPRTIKLPEEFKGIGYLEVDFGVGNSGLILAQAVDATVMHLYSLHTLAHLAELKSPAHLSPITAVHWDIPKYEKPMISDSNGHSPTHHFHGRQEMSSLLATGDAAGNICLWYLSDTHRRHAQQNKSTLHPSQHLREPVQMEPVSVLKGHESRVTSLFVDKLVIVSGGYTRGRDPNDATNSVVKCISVNSLQCRGVVSIGGLIRSWDFSPEANAAKVQNDIRHSLLESVSLKRLAHQAKERQEQLHRRYNNLEGLNMVDMTDEEVVEYVMMLSKDQEEKDQIVQEILEVQRLKEMEDCLLDEQTNGGEGSSGGAKAVRITNFVPEAASDKEREEEEALVQRAIEMSMLDMQELDEDRHRDHHGHHHHHYTESEPNGSVGGILEDQLHVHVPTSWDLSDIVNVDNHKASNNLIREDQSIVQSVLEELLDAEDALEANKAALRTNNDKSWPSIISKSSVSEEKDPQESELSTPSPARSSVPPLQQKMSWSQVARTTSASSLASSTGSQKQQLSIIKTYRPRDEDEDEDTQLARILSLSMIEK
ncbi:hypothetical protein BG006_006788 [Podila minutissima]|uniref:F-box domain-containing protein n=1 Tax=Podila minutissima TaxID=64525 RepID=A0A9P5VL65_9FUNG|nr:hypothetical protein BG006_006788 [Podila minutissima]